MKGKGERERYSQLTAEFQKIGRRDKKAFLSEQCREIEENNRMGKARYLFKKIGDTKGTFSCKDRHSKEQMARTKQKQKRSIKGGKNREKNSIKKPIMTQIAMMVWSLT